MPKPVKKSARTPKVPSTIKATKRSSDPALAARKSLDEHMAQVRGQPAADQPILDPETVIREHMRQTAAKGGTASAAKRTDHGPGKPRPSDQKLAARTALVRYLTHATADEPDDKPPTFDELYRAHMAELGAKGGRTSGAKRMENLSDRQRKEIAKKAAAARWSRKKA